MEFLVCALGAPHIRAKQVERLLGKDAKSSKSSSKKWPKMKAEQAEKHPESAAGSSKQSVSPRIYSAKKAGEGKSSEGKSPKLKEARITEPEPEEAEEAADDSEPGSAQSSVDESEATERTGKSSSKTWNKWPSDIKELSKKEFMTAEMKKSRHTVKNTVHCPYCISIFTMRSECQAHMKAVHPITLGEEGVLVASRRMYYLRREGGVRHLPKSKYQLHIAALPELPKVSREKVIRIIDNILADCLTLGGNETKKPESHHMKFKPKLMEMKKFYGDVYPTRP